MPHQSSHYPQMPQPQQQQNIRMPQDKTFNLNSLNQKGAFIPLQVSRGNNNLSKNSQVATTSVKNQKDSVATNKDVIVQNVCNLLLLIKLFIVILLSFIFSLFS